MPFEMLSDAALRLIAGDWCPDCHQRGFIRGPRGGMAVNIECRNAACKARFNVADVHNQPLWAHRIEKQSEGGADWSTLPPLRPLSERMRLLPPKDDEDEI